MHGRLKVRTTEEQKLLKQKEQKKKLLAYQMGMEQILSTRRKDDYKPESLGICTQILISNPDIYTLWNYRKEVVLMEIAKCKNIEDGKEKLSSGDDEGKEKLREDDVEKEKLSGGGDEKLSKDIEEDENLLNLIKFLDNEVRLTEQCLLANPKSYGAWHHRYWVLTKHPKPNWKHEFNLCEKYLNVDDRNFHVWDYRRLIVNKIDLTLTDELRFSQDRLNENFSNYSSWHYRSTLRKLDKDSAAYELSLVQSAVFTDPADSSGWFYLRWVLSNPGIKKEIQEELMNALEQLEELEPDCKWIVLAKCWLTGSLVLSDENYVDRRVQFYQKLEKLDPMRKGQYRDYLKFAEEKSKKLQEAN